MWNYDCLNSTIKKGFSQKYAFYILSSLKEIVIRFNNKQNTCCR